MRQLKNQIALFLHQRGVSANFLTALGLLIAFGAAFLVARGEFFWGGAVYLLAGGIDLLDGAVARASGKAGHFGGVLDSSLDRYGDGAVLGALVLFYASTKEMLYATLALSALLGSFAISYVRARAECEVDSCRVGFWERGERIVYLSLGLLVNNAAMALWALGIFTHVTAAQRLFLSKKLLAGGASPVSDAHLRARWSYRLQVLGWLLALFLIRPLG